MISLKEINTLERTFLEMLEYKLMIKGSEYAKYYFILRSLDQESDSKFPIRPLARDKIARLQEQATHAEKAFKHLHTTRKMQKTL